MLREHPICLVLYSSLQPTHIHYFTIVRTRLSHSVYLFVLIFSYSHVYKAGIWRSFPHRLLPIAYFSNTVEAHVVDRA